MKEALPPGSRASLKLGTENLIGLFWKGFHCQDEANQLDQPAAPSLMGHHLGHSHEHISKLSLPPGSSSSSCQTSNTLSWTLYHLAKDPTAQDRLYNEVNSVCPNRREPATEDLASMPFLKAVIKEVLR